MSAGIENAHALESLFDRLYVDHNRALHAYFLARASDPELALDLLQEAFLRVWRNIGTLQPLPPERQRYWLFAAARNLVVDQYRSRAARTTMLERLTGNAHSPAGPESPEIAAEQGEQMSALDAAIQRLPDDLRSALLLQVLGELSSGEIGELLDRPAGTIRYHISLARKRLATEINAADSLSSQEVHSRS